MNDEREHLLLQKTRTAPVFRGDLSPADCRYELAIGAWLVGTSDVLFVETPRGRSGPRTKKFDVETGEDQKGE